MLKFQKQFFQFISQIKITSSWLRCTFTNMPSRRYKTQPSVFSPLRLLFSLVFLINCAICVYDHGKILIDISGEYSANLAYSSNVRDSISSNGQSRIIENLKFSFKAETDHQLDIKFNDAIDLNRFSMPKIEPFNSLYRDFEDSK